MHAPESRSSWQPQVWLPSRILETVYKKEGYTPKSPSDRVKRCWLHYLIAFDQPEKEIVAKIKGAKNLNSLLNADSEAYGLTPMHLSVLKMKTGVAAAILEKLKSTPQELNACLQAQDTEGWTPLHHAVLVSPEIEKMLSTACNLRTFPKTHAGGTVEDIRILAGLKPSNFTAKCITLRLPDKPEVKLSELSSEQLKEAIGLEHYSDSSVFEPSQWMQLWSQKIEEKQGTQILFHQCLEKKYADCQKKPFSLAVGTCQQLLERGIPHPLELYANAEIAPMEVIGEYSGLSNSSSSDQEVRSLPQMVAEHKISSPFVLNDVDALTWGNFGRMANCGWPTALLLKTTTDGLSDRCLIVTAMHHRAGQPVRYSYGQKYHVLTLGVQVPLGIEEAREYYKAGLRPKLKLRQKLIKQAELILTGYPDLTQGENAKVIDIHFQINCIDQYLNFCVQNPVFMLDLHLNGLVKAKEWLEQIYKGKIFAAELANQPYTSMLMIRILRCVDEFEQATLAQPQREFAVSWVKKAVGVMPLTDILKALQLMQSADFARLTSSAKMQEFLQTKLQGYDWTTDHDGPIGWKARALEALNLNLARVTPDIYLLQLMRDEINASNLKGDLTEYLDMIRYQMEHLKTKVSAEAKIILDKLLHGKK